MLRADSDVQEVARTSSVHDLVAAFNKYVTADRTPESAALAYVMLVALSLKDCEEAASAIKDLDARSLEWGDKVRQIAITTPVRVETVQVSAAIPINNRLDAPRARHATIPPKRRRPFGRSF